MVKTEGTEMSNGKIRKFDLDDRSDAVKTLSFTGAPLGQRCPTEYPHPAKTNPHNFTGSALGTPLSIRETARLLGCSVWTVRNRYLQRGLPHLRASAEGKIVFFREQVIEWILKQQQKGG
jgi:hypothetical protein